jgi:hypothetical protein
MSTLTRVSQLAKQSRKFGWDVTVRANIAPAEDERDWDGEPFTIEKIEELFGEGRSWFIRFSHPLSRLPQEQTRAIRNVEGKPVEIDGVPFLRWGDREQHGDALRNYRDFDIAYRDVSIVHVTGEGNLNGKSTKGSYRTEVSLKEIERHLDRKVVTSLAAIPALREFESSCSQFEASSGRVGRAEEELAQIRAEHAQNINRVSRAAMALKKAEAPK